MKAWGSALTLRWLLVQLRTAYAEKPDQAPGLQKMIDGVDEVIRMKQEQIDQLTLTSYEDDAIRTKVETWADSVPALA